MLDVTRPWLEVETFALAFDGHEAFPDEGCANLANKIIDEFSKSAKTLENLTLTELRACLFFEQRRCHHSYRATSQNRVSGYCPVCLPSIRWNHIFADMWAVFTDACMAGPIAHHRMSVVAAISKYDNVAYKRRSAQMKGNAEAGRSAYGAASMKATEAFVPAPQRLFEDEIVMDFLPRPVQFLLRRSAIRAVFLSLLEASAPGIRGAMLCRTRRIDDAVRNAIHQGLPALVILGAGLDTRPYRFTESADVNIVEIDLPSVQEFKKTCLLRKFGALPSHVRFVHSDLNTEQLDTALETGRLNSSKPAIFLWEGVSQYLQPNAVDSVLASISKRPKGTVLVFTYVLQEVITGIYRSDRSEAFRKSASRQPEPWHFGVDPRQLRAFLAARGLSLRHDFGAEEHQTDYLRPVGRILEVSEIERVAIAIV